MTIIRKALTAIAAASVLASSAAHATLVPRSNTMIYDSAQDITWLADANLLRTEFFDLSDGKPGDADGRVSWTAANQWANDLVVSGESNWRLPDIIELQSLFQFSPVAAGFTNVMSLYWTADLRITSATNAPLNAYAVDMRNGRLGYGLIGAESSFVWAVSDGDVGQTPRQILSEPNALPLLLCGLFAVGVGLRANRRHRLAAKE